MKIANVLSDLFLWVVASMVLNVLYDDKLKNVKWKKSIKNWNLRLSVIYFCVD